MCIGGPFFAFSTRHACLVGNMQKELEERSNDKLTSHSERIIATCSLPHQIGNGSAQLMASLAASVTGA